MGLTTSSTRFKIIGRSSGKNAVASAAYRSGEKLTDHESGNAKNYSRKTGVMESDILIPDHAPEELKNRETLWNQVEQSENRSDAQLARECLILLPKETTHEENKKAVHEYCQKEFVDKGMIADINMHDQTNGNNNRHAHVMLTLRQVDEHGRWGQKKENLQWNEKDQMLKWNQAWDDHMNSVLEKGGYDAHIDNRSDYEKDLDKIPEEELDQMSEKDFEQLAEATEKPKVSLAASHIEKRGEKSWQVEEQENWKERAKAYFKTKAQEYRAKSQELLKRLSDGRKEITGNGKGSDSNAEAVRRNEQQSDGKTRSDSEVSGGDRQAVDRSGTDTGPRSESDAILERLTKKYGKQSEQLSVQAERDRQSVSKSDRPEDPAARSVERQISNRDRQSDRRGSQQDSPPKDNVQRTDDKGRVSELAKGKSTLATNKSNDMDQQGISGDTGLQRANIDESRITNQDRTLDSSNTGERVSDLPVKPKRTRKERKPRDPAKSNRKPRQRSDTKERKLEKERERQRQREPEGRSR